MTGFKSKKAAALDEEGMYLVHHTKGRVFDKLGNKVKPVQAPVGNFAKFTDGIWREVTDGSEGVPLYTAPQRTWVGSSDLEDSNAYLTKPDLTDADRKTYQAGHNAGVAHHKQATKRTWVSLTDDQIKEIVGPWGDTPIKGYTRKLIDQIDAKLRENNNG